jgi:hypothetical protein
MGAEIAMRAAMIAAALVASSCSRWVGPQAEALVLHEGLPHQMFESDLLQEELRTKAVERLDGYPFYREPLALAAEDAKRLSRILGDPATYKPFSGEKLCGGFHPDYAVEWHVGSDRYLVLICFGCHEAKRSGPGLKTRDDLAYAAYNELQALLKGCRKNRPAGK